MRNTIKTLWRMIIRLGYDVVQLIAVILGAIAMLFGKAGEAVRDLGKMGYEALCKEKTVKKVKTNTNE